MLKRSLFFAFFTLLLGFVAFSFMPTEPAIAQESDLLVSLPVTEAPILDGVADDAAWTDAQAILIETRRGAFDYETEVSLKSVYTEDTVYFLISYADTTHSYLRSPWEMQADGTWMRLSDPDDKGGDNNLWYEDKFSMIWTIGNSIEGFDEEGCFVACHRSEDESDPKPYGNKYIENEGGLGDMWHWKSVRNLNQFHDQYLDSAEYSAENVNAGRHSDPDDSTGYRNNINEAGDAPAFMPAGEFTHDGAPGFLLETEIVPFDASLFVAGDRLPSIIISEFTGDGGDISAAWLWADGVWTLEISRALVTGSEFDVQFEDLSETYYFGVAAFDNAQVRHAFQRGVSRFQFGQ